jgi:hypothetical protein
MAEFKQLVTEIAYASSLSANVPRVGILFGKDNSPKWNEN